MLRTVDALAISSLWMSAVTMRTGLSFADGPAVNLYGFPLPYWRFSGVSSLEYAVDPVALAIDLALHVLVVALLLTWARLTVSWWWRGPLYVVAGLVVALQATFVTGTGPMVDAAFPPDEIVRRLHVGLDRPY